MTSLSGPEAVALAQSVLDAQPFSVLVGARVEQMAPDGVVVRVPFRTEPTQHHGFAHGGVQAALADIALAAASGPSVWTSEVKINFLRPAVGEALVARGSVVSASRRQAVTRCDLFTMQGEQEKLVATAPAPAGGEL